jgi:hypothetical protein
LRPYRREKDQRQKKGKHNSSHLRAKLGAESKASRQRTEETHCCVGECYVEARKNSLVSHSDPEESTCLAKRLGHAVLRSTWLSMQLSASRFKDIGVISASCGVLLYNLDNKSAG